MIRQLISAIALTGVTAPAVESQLASHRVEMVATQPGVRLEVLDWGGAGPPLVFLAGFGDTGHVFDNFAPQFTNRYHVRAITRRGFGVSSRPHSGYDTGTLAQDIVTVLDSLGIRRATFVGHSFAGSELTYLGAFHAERVVQLIYVDASYDFARLYADPRWKRAFPIPRPATPTSRVLDGWRRWFSLVMGPGVPDDEIRILMSSTGPDLSNALQRGAQASALRRVRVPVLALWAAPRSIEDQYPYWRSLDSADLARLRAAFADQQTVRQSHFQEFRADVPHARANTVAGGRHYLFLSNRTQVTNAMSAFLASSHAPPNDR